MGGQKTLASKIFLSFFFLLLILPWPIASQPTIPPSAPIIKLRFYRGQRTLAYEPLTIVTSSYLSPVISANIPSSTDLEQERKQIQRVFNLMDVHLLTKADLAWTDLAKFPKETLTHVLRFDSREIFVAISSSMTKMTDQNVMISPNLFTISVSEQFGQEKLDLLTTEIIIPAKNVAILGFESRDGIPYFLALQVLFPSPTEKKGPTVGGVMGGVVGEPTKTASGAVKAIGAIKPPRLIKKVEPIYPEAAKQAGIEGVVILEVEIDEQGKVTRTTLLRSVPPLDQAAIDAVKQWQYEPAIIDGKPTPLIFTVTVAFRLNRQIG